MNTKSENDKNNVNKFFHKISAKAAEILGNAWIFILATALIIVWLLVGPLFNFSDTWQLIANTITSVTTFLMVFIIQNTQNRDSKSIQLKLDELIRSHKQAHNSIIDLEKLSDEQLKELENKYNEFSLADTHEEQIK